uniref:Uncharacterized protein n=1 Tax=Candidatus Kentrum sp. FM TaxID=2126340 RepID=A0A450SR53_9GAMM|nr:MAG: hypothetical protein BECKFM1743C_GA0114222_101791 [Candidatus Kentron sp. FM]
MTFAYSSQVRDFLPSFDTDVIKNKQKRVFFLLCVLVLIRNFLSIYCFWLLSDSGLIDGMRIT